MMQPCCSSAPVLIYDVTPSHCTKPPLWNAVARERGLAGLVGRFTGNFPLYPNSRIVLNRIGDWGSPQEYRSFTPFIDCHRSYLLYTLSQLSVRVWKGCVYSRTIWGASRNTQLFRTLSETQIRMEDSRIQILDPEFQDTSQLYSQSLISAADKVGNLVTGNLVITGKAVLPRYR